MLKTLRIYNYYFIKYINQLLIFQQKQLKTS